MCNRSEKETIDMHRNSFSVWATVGVALLAFGAVSAASVGATLAIPAGFEHWYLVN